MQIVAFRPHPLNETSNYTPSVICMHARQKLHSSGSLSDLIYKAGQMPWREDVISQNGGRKFI